MCSHDFVIVLLVQWLALLKKAQGFQKIRVQQQGFLQQGRAPVISGDVFS